MFVDCRQTEWRVLVFLIYCAFTVDLLRLTRTSSGEIREKTQCKINKIMMGKVKQIINKINSLKSLASIFSNSLFAIRVNLLHPLPSYFVHLCFILHEPLWCFSVHSLFLCLLKYYLFNGNFVKDQNNSITIMMEPL